MRDTTRAEKLLSLFTSADRAAAIAGDLTEQRQRHKPLLFWLDVLGTVSALWRAAVIDSPLRVLSLAASACGLLFATLLTGIAAVFLIPALMDSIARWIVLPLFWWTGALATGALLVRVAPIHGMAVAATLALVGDALLVVLVARAFRLDLLFGDLVLFCTTGLLAAVPLLAGAAIARRRLTGRAISAWEQNP